MRTCAGCMHWSMDFCDIYAEEIDGADERAELCAAFDGVSGAEEDTDELDIDSDDIEVVGNMDTDDDDFVPDEDDLEEFNEEEDL